MENKGQSALEYLMTYGWALVVIVIVIAALFAFGIFNPPAAGTCTGLDKLAYEDHAHVDGELTIALMNRTGSVIQHATIGVEAPDYGDATITVEEGPWNLGQRKVITIDNAEPMTSPVIIRIEYESGAGITHVETASCSFS